MSTRESHKQALRQIVDHFVGNMRGPSFKEQLVDEILRVNGSGEGSASVVELNLCETERLILRPDTLYRFVVAPNCNRCTELGVICRQQEKQA